MTIDLSQFYDFLDLPPDMMLLKFLYMFGWIPLAYIILWGAKELWMLYIQIQWGSQQKYTLLAIDIPKLNMQSPKAVESIFIYLLGAHGNLNLIEIYWEGKYQLSFSLEIASIEGYTQFIIRTPAAFKNLVESAIYSQYPDAEITEIDDYTEGFPRKFPDQQYDIWGSEFIQSHPQAYPIKTYPEFLDSMGKPEEQFKDPMATLMDLCSSLQKGEHLWYQIIINPLGFDWIGIGDKEVKKIMKEKDPPKQNIVDKLAALFIGSLEFIGNLFYTTEAAKTETKTEDPLKMMNLKPAEKKRVESIQMKVSKMGFATKMRMVYVAEKEVLNKAKVVNGFVGYLKQFTDLDLNGLKPDSAKTATSTAYFFKNYRLNIKKNKIMNNYIGRDLTSGRSPGVFNTEELATLWHFPVDTAVKAPLIQKAPGRKGEPPMSLPMDEDDEAQPLDEDIFGKDFEDDLFIEEEKTDKIDKAEKNKEKSEFIDDKDDIFSLEDDEEGAENKSEPKKPAEPPKNLPFA
jgi:hypothetical protein